MEFLYFETSIPPENSSSIGWNPSKLLVVRKPPQRRYDLILPSLREMKDSLAWLRRAKKV
jgi:hypothetical protein